MGDIQTRVSINQEYFSRKELTAIIYGVDCSKASERITCQPISLAAAGLSCELFTATTLIVNVRRRKRRTVITGHYPEIKDKKGPTAI